MSDENVIYVGDDQGRGGLYNMLFPGAFERADLILPAVLINPDAVSLFRYRDCWIERDGDDYAVHVYTRIGGNNRASYAAIIDMLREGRYYLRDADDSYDSTYASFWFRVPEHLVPVIKETGIAVDPIDTAQRWRDMQASWERS